MRQMLAAQQAAAATGAGSGRGCRRIRPRPLPLPPPPNRPPLHPRDPAGRVRRGRSDHLGQSRAQRCLPLRIGREVQALPRSPRLSRPATARPGTQSAALWATDLVSIAASARKPTPIMPFLRQYWRSTPVQYDSRAGALPCFWRKKFLRITAAVAVAAAAAHTAERLKAPAFQQVAAGVSRPNSQRPKCALPSYLCRFGPVPKSASLSTAVENPVGDLTGITPVAATTPPAAGDSCRPELRLSVLPGAMIHREWTEHGGRRRRCGPC
jgi:hypothetical protein